jgi:hypothetical protein
LPALAQWPAEQPSRAIAASFGLGVRATGGQSSATTLASRSFGLTTLG